MMTSNETIDALNRVLASLARSFTQYMRYSRPYVPAGRERVNETLEGIVNGQDALAERVTQMIHEAGGLPDNGEFPIEYTDSHDLSIDFLVLEAIQGQKRDIADLTQCVEQLRLAPAAQSLAAEALGMAKGNLEVLQELSQQPQAAMKVDGTPAFANDVPVKNEVTGEPHRQEERKILAGKPNSPG
jgi:bacterioferritin (cytochrome b1)